jgi:hypothetical protein
MVCGFSSGAARLRPLPGFGLVLHQRVAALVMSFPLLRAMCVTLLTHTHTLTQPHAALLCPLCLTLLVACLAYQRSAPLIQFHVHSCAQILSETLLSLSPARLPSLFISISGNQAQLDHAAKAAFFKLAKHGSKKLPLFVRNSLMSTPSLLRPSCYWRQLPHMILIWIIRVRRRVTPQCVCSTIAWVLWPPMEIKA